MMIEYRESPEVTNSVLNALFKSAWVDHKETDFIGSLERCALWICAYDQDLVVGFVKIVWDGGEHGFILDTTVHSRYQRRGIGKKLLDQAAAASHTIGIKVLHVDFESHLIQFYRAAGYKQTEAGLLKLSESCQ